MNIHAVSIGEVGAFVNALFYCSPDECWPLSSFSYVPIWGGLLQVESFYMSPGVQCLLRILVPYLIRLKYGLLQLTQKTHGSLSSIRLLGVKIIYQVFFYRYKLSLGII